MCNYNNYIRPGGALVFGSCSSCVLPAWFVASCDISVLVDQYHARAEKRKSFGILLLNLERTGKD